MTTDSETNQPPAAEASGESKPGEADKPRSPSERARAYLASCASVETALGEGGPEAGSETGDAGGARSSNGDDRRGEVSAATVGRMLGLVTSSDLVVIEKKLDLLCARVNAITSKLDRLGSAMAGLPAGADFERLEVQLGVLRSGLKEVLAKLPQNTEDGQQLAKTKIQSNQPQTFGGKVFTRIRKDDEGE